MNREDKIFWLGTLAFLGGALAMAVSESEREKRIAREHAAQPTPPPQPPVITVTRVGQLAKPTVTLPVPKPGQYIDYEIVKNEDNG